MLKVVGGLNPNSLGNNFPGTYYAGPNNPTNTDGLPNYSLAPRNLSDAIAKLHDQNYDKVYAKGAYSLLLNNTVAKYDRSFVEQQFTVVGMYISQLVTGRNQFDPFTLNRISLQTAFTAAATGTIIGLTTSWKATIFKY